MKPLYTHVLFILLAIGIYFTPFIFSQSKESSGKNPNRITVGEFEDGKGWKKAIPEQGLLCTDDQLQAFYKALGKPCTITVDFSKELLYISTQPSYDLRPVRYIPTVDKNGNLTLTGGPYTRIGYMKPMKGPYYTRIVLTRVPAKGVRTFNGKPLNKDKAFRILHQGKVDLGVSACYNTAADFERFLKNKRIPAPCRKILVDASVDFSRYGVFVYSYTYSGSGSARPAEGFTLDKERLICKVQDQNKSNKRTMDYRPHRRYAIVTYDRKRVAEIDCIDTMGITKGRVYPAIVPEQPDEDYAIRLIRGFPAYRALTDAEIRGLREVNLQNYYLSVADHCALAQLKKLESLKLGRLALGKGRAEALAKASNIKALSFSRGRVAITLRTPTPEDITDKDLRIISSMKLESLDLAGCRHLSVEGLAVIKTMSSLKTLLLRGTKAIDSFFNSLVDLKNLEAVSLTYSKSHSDNGIKRLKDLPLKRLDIHCAAITDDRIETIVSQFPNLTELYLKGVKRVTPKSLDALASLKNLKYLNIEASGIPKADAQKRLPKVTFYTKEFPFSE